MEAYKITNDVDRPLTAEERDFIYRLLDAGGDRSRAFIPQIILARVTGECCCGCPSLNLSIGGETHYKSTTMDILCGYRWSSPEGYLFGVFVFACGGLLAGLDLWSIDGLAIPDKFPPTSAIFPIDLN